MKIDQCIPLQGPACTGVPPRKITGPCMQDRFKPTSVTNVAPPHGVPTGTIRAGAQKINLLDFLQMRYQAAPLFDLSLVSPELAAAAAQGLAVLDLGTTL